MLDRYKKFYKDRDNQKEYAKWLMHYTKPYLPSLSMLLLVQIIAVVLSTQMSIASKNIIDRAQEGQPITITIVIFIAIMFANTALSIGASLVAIVVGEKFAFGIRKNVYEKILSTSWSHINKYHTGDLNTRLTSDTDAIANGIATTIPSIIILGFQLVYNFAILFTYSKFLALVSLLIAPIALLASAILGRKLKQMQVKVQESEARYRSFLQESLSNIMVIKAFCDEDHSAERLTELRNDRLYWILKKNRLSLATSSTINVSFQIGYIIAFSWGAMGIYNGSITYGTLSLFLALAGSIQSPLIGLAQTIPKVISILASAGRVIELQNLPSELKREQTIEARQIGADVEHLSFGYNDNLIFEDTSLHINPGDFVAIVGESGIGKTTLIRLIMSFLNSSAGSITFFNELGQREETAASSRYFISYVPQGNTLFSGTIAENVRMGRRTATDEEILEALKASSAYDFVKELPEGVNTVIGEKGLGISEGQAQRVALARALVRKAPFLVLDEATASLDEKTELRVLEGIRQLTPKPTCILITHRRSVLAYCDREIKIEDHKIHDIPLGDM